VPAGRPERRREAKAKAMAKRSETRHADFGFERVSEAEKDRRVAGVFDSVAARYDLMNDLMSFGLHRAWKRFAVAVCGLRPGMRVLDLAGGTGDLSALVYSEVGAGGRIVLADINSSMLVRGRERLLDRGMLPRVQVARADAERLPFLDRSFDCVIMAFGLRNVTRKEVALAAIFRTLRPGGRLVVLEFSTAAGRVLRACYDAYSFKLLPALGRLVAGDEGSYRYLAESIRMHPDQSMLREMFEAAGFERCTFFNLTSGVVAVHRGYRLR